jgi:hypothetical protein
MWQPTKETFVLVVGCPAGPILRWLSGAFTGMRRRKIFPSRTGLPWYQGPSSIWFYRYPDGKGEIMVYTSPGGEVTGVCFALKRFWPKRWATPLDCAQEAARVTGGVAAFSTDAMASWTEIRPGPGGELEVIDRLQRPDWIPIVANPG